ncbi:unnamed protein product [Hymenolepis diminuta]|uniref:Uncharacterized protein n=1 Tax=Hymenolepis diminuta TaxID=6216 RepID=A0A564Z7V8_HYMDI|nr:unnamed protein product [Hymenolepis diminuta]
MLTLMYSFSTSLWRCDFLSAQLRQLSSVLTICVKVALFSSLPSPKMSYETGPGVNAVCATFTYPFSDPRLCCESPFGVPNFDVQKLITGAEFIPRFHLFVNLKDRSLNNTLLSFHVICATNIPDSIGPNVFLPISNAFSNILSEFVAKMAEPNHEV